MSLSPRLAWPLGAVLLALLWAALAPLGEASRERVLEFPRGAAALRGSAAGDSLVPGELRLTLGVRDVLLLRNRDIVPHVFGQVLVLPGHDFRLPFEQAGSTSFACDVAPRARVLVRVLPEPDPGWQRLRWRWQTLLEGVRELPLVAPDS